MLLSAPIRGYLASSGVRVTPTSYQDSKVLLTFQCSSEQREQLSGELGGSPPYSCLGSCRLRRSIDKEKQKRGFLPGQSIPRI
jgi:hypothetical protein